MTEFKFDGQPFPYDFTPLSPEAQATYDRLTVDRFKVKQMITVRPPPGSKGTDVTIHEGRILTIIAEYEEAKGKPLHCAGYVTAGPKGYERAEAHLVFQKNYPPDMILLKRICRQYGHPKVSGEYDPGEDWMSMSREQKNRPLHNGCLHYVAQHADHPDGRWIWNEVLPEGRKTKDQAKFDKAKARMEAEKKRRTEAYEQRQRGAEFQRELDDAAWLAQNDRPHKTPIGYVKPLPWRT